LEAVASIFITQMNPQNITFMQVGSSGFNFHYSNESSKYNLYAGWKQWLQFLLLK
jgi:hypothetical protein